MKFEIYFALYCLTAVTAGQIQFEEFALDRDRYELSRDGQPIKLEKLPMELLMLLVERGGHLVTRQQIIDRLWGQDVFLDTEHGINTAIFKLRTVLGDNAGQARFIQTVTGKGYRFVASTSIVATSPDLTASQPALAPGPLSADSATSERSVKEALSEPVSPSRPRWMLWTAGTCLMVVLVAGVAFWMLHQLNRGNNQPLGSRIHSLAVLPLQNLSGDPGQEYFADGITDELITMLAKNTGLRVISRTSAMQYKNAHLPLPEIARQLGVDGILEGSVGRSGDRVHVNVQLVYAPTDSHLWADSYDRSLGDVGMLESQLASTIAEQVGLTVSNGSATPRPVRPEAHDAYLWGRYYWFGSSDKSGEYFQKAIDLQPDYADAWSGLADSLISDAVAGDVPPAQVVNRAESAARKALELDPQLGDAHRAMGAIRLFGHWDYVGADTESARAIELDPNDSEDHHLRSYVVEALDRKSEALQEQKLATELDPRLRPWATADLFIRLHRFDDAIQDALARIEAEPEDSGLHEALSDAYRAKDMDKQSTDELAKMFVQDGKQRDADAALEAFAEGGMKAVLEWRLKQDQEQAGKHYVPAYHLALDYARLRRKEDTLRNLERAYKEREPRLIFLREEPDFDFVRSEPRYQAIESAMKFPLSDRVAIRRREPTRCGTTRLASISACGFRRRSSRTSLHPSAG